MTEKFNKLRMSVAGQKLSKKQLKSLFEEHLDTNLSPAWMHVLRKHEILLEHRKGRQHAFSFCCTPVHKEKMKSLLTEIKEYNKKHIKPKLAIQMDAIQDAINLLKENGYRILKPTTTFEEI